MAKECVLFDHDGVLVDTEPWYFEAGRRALAELGFTADLGDYLDDMAQGRGTWARARAAWITDEAIDRARAARDSYYREYLRTEDLEIEGVLAVLTELSSNVRMAIVTTARPSDLELIHRTREILPLMELVLTRDDYELAKPHPETYLTALVRLGVPAEQTLVVEDSARGLASAVAAGIDCCVVHHDFTATQDLSAAKYRIEAIGDLPALLTRLK